MIVTTPDYGQCGVGTFLARLEFVMRAEINKPRSIGYAHPVMISQNGLLFASNDRHVRAVKLPDGGHPALGLPRERIALHHGMV